MYNNFEISLVVFMPNITTNHAITYTNFWRGSHPVVELAVIKCNYNDHLLSANCIDGNKGRTSVFLDGREGWGLRNYLLKTCP